MKSNREDNNIISINIIYVLMIIIYYNIDIKMFNLYTT